MGLLNCFCSLKEKKDKGQKPADKDNKVKTLHVKLENLQKSSETKELRSTSFTVPVPLTLHGGSRCKVKVTSHDDPIASNSVEVDYEGGDEHDECSLMKRDNSDFDLQSHVKNSNEENHQNDEKLNATCSNDNFEFITSDHVSDPGMDNAEFLASPKLKRSCSSLEMRNISREFVENLAPLKSKSYENIQRLSKMQTDEILLRDVASPLSVMTYRSADKVMLKKHSSSQILPSRSRILWWKLFLWSHGNMHISETRKREETETKSFALNNKRGGYSSDTLEPLQAMEENRFTSPSSLSAKSMDKGKSKLDDQRWDEYYGVTGNWPQNQWVAFSSESSPLARVDEWVKEVSSRAPCEAEDHDDEIESEITFPPSPENDAERGSSHLARHLVPEEILHANSVIQSLNASSTVAHITAIGLKVVPSISHFSSLRSVNLSGNSIVHITAGSLPKGLHVLDLSRNKINTIEGLRELTRLRVLDLSYNRISRIGQGLASCTIIKELYLTGNKISDVEGLHRLLKLTVLDLSFNKITTTKALGQLVANYNSLMALNLLGNPIQSNISDDQLCKTVCSLLPKLAFLNKQPIAPRKAREVHANAIARAALGSSNRSSRRKVVKRVSNRGSSSSSSPVVRRSSASTGVGGTERSGRHR